MAVITIGPGATDRDAAGAAAYTFIQSDGAADGSGSITSFETWFATNGTGLIMGTASGSGTTYTTRDSETIGAVTAGSKQTFSGKNCDVIAGDFIVYYFATGTSEWTGASGSYYYKTGDQFGAGAQTYTNFTGTHSVYGTGVTAGWANIAKVGGVAAASMAKINGVAVVAVAKINGVAV